MTIVDKRYAPNSSQCQGYEFNLVNGTVLHCHLADAAHFSSNGTDWAATVPDLRDGNMHHVALTLVRNSTTGGHIYVDGVQVLEFNPTAQAGDLSTPSLCASAITPMQPIIHSSKEGLTSWPSTGVLFRAMKLLPSTMPV